MNRTGLFIALAIAVLVGAVFALYPKLDLAISALFFNPQSHMFEVNGQAWVRHSRDAARLVSAILVAPAFLALVGKLFRPRRRTLIGIRAALFLAWTMVLGPGVLTNIILKDHWGRSRPIDVTEFHATDRFTAWWDPRGQCPTNCSFIAGEPSGAFWTLAPAALAPPQWRPLAYAGALIFGAAVGLLRIAAGGHFFSDVVFAGVFTFLLIWMAHGVLYRWSATQFSDETLERPLIVINSATQRRFARLVRRLSGRPAEPS